MERGQREHYLQEQLRVIQQELGSREDGGNEFTELRELIEKAGMPKEVRAKADREFQRYERLPLMSPESAVLRGYLEWLCDMPWSKRTKDAIDLKRASEVLDADHFGLEKVKERILEFLAVRSSTSKESRSCAWSASRRGEDLPRPVDCPGHGPEIRPRVPGRRARRGRNPGHRRTYVAPCPAGSSRASRRRA